jgi:hypothetical protein
VRALFGALRGHPHEFGKFVKSRAQDVENGEENQVGINRDRHGNGYVGVIGRVKNGIAT